MSFKLTNPKISLNTGADLSVASNPEIHFIKPDGTTGEWSATINEENIEYQTTSDDIDQTGIWTFQAVALFGQNTNKGDKVEFRIDDPIKTT